MIRKNILTFLLISGLLGWLSNNIQAQDLSGNKGSGLLVNISYAYQVPGGDLAERFGNNFNIGLNLEYLTEKSNLIFGVETGYLFDNDLKIEVFKNLCSD